MTETSIDQLQALIYERILSDPYLADAAILLEQNGLIESDITRALGAFNQRPGSTKVGVLILVMLPELDLSSVDAPGPQLNLSPVLRVVEKPLVNRTSSGTGLTAAAVASRLLRLFHHWSPGAANMIYVDQQAARSAVLPDPTVIAYDVYLKTSAGYDGARIAQPRIIHDGGTITMVSQHPQASIWYTLNGDYPRPAIEAATKYTAPFPAPSPGVLIRSAAYYQSQIPSNISTLTI